MFRFTHSLLPSLLVAALVQVSPAFGADAESDALDLESAPVVAPKQSARDTKIFAEGAIGVVSQRYGLGSNSLSRFSIDISHTARLSAGWRAVISDRLDQIHPRDPAGADETVNSLREAYLSWQPEGGSSLVQFGRINLRYGPGYGYNPTDFFRDGSLRAVTTADPFALRENRLGSVMLRAQSTNNRDRGLIALGTKFSQSVSSQLLLYKQGGLPPALGANMTVLVSDAATAHLEWSRGKEPSLLSRAMVLNALPVTRNRFVGGVTYTTLGKLSLTAEYQYNGFGTSKADWGALAGTPGIQLSYLRESLRLQELAARQAFLLYITQKGFGLKDLDLTAYIRFNPNDNSRLAWVELRHHWSNFDLTLQYQRNIGSSTSEFGILPDRRIIQVLGTYYF